jgi:hypothetical protein
MDYKELVKSCYSLSDFCKILGIHTNGRGIKKVKELIIIEKLNISHFDNGLRKKIKYKKIKKKCPVCNTSFETSKRGDRKEKITCSISCSNTHFRSGENNGNWKDISEYNNRTRTFALKYRKICFDFHNHKCVVCDECKVLDVHHFDEDKFNNEPNNLIPICATHHNYLHSIYRHEIIEKVNEYRENYIKENTKI